MDAALELFAGYGVKATTLQMIADRMGVSKAAIYYHFRTKDEIVMAVTQPVFDDLARLVRIAEAMSGPDAQREVVVSGLVELTVRHRRLSAVVQSDPAVTALLNSHKELENAVASLITMLDGPKPDAMSRITTSVIFNGICTSAMDPRLHDVTDEDLRRTLLECAQRLLHTQLGNKTRSGA